MGKINMGFFYGKLFNSRNRTFSFENGENFIEGTGHCIIYGYLTTRLLFTATIHLVVYYYVLLNVCLAHIIINHFPG